MRQENIEQEVKGGFDPIIKEISEDDLRQFLDFAQVTPKCWLCGQNSLHPLRAQYRDVEKDELFVSKDRPAFVAMTIQSDLDEGFEVRVPAFVMSCSSCGFTYNVSAIPLMAWKRERIDDD